MRSDLLEQFYNFSEVTSIHGIKHAMASGGRRFRNRLLWAAVVVVFASLCFTLQLFLFHEVLFLKPTTVERTFELKHTLNMPNVVICDLNSEKDAFFDYFEQFGNTAEAGFFFFQFSQSYLFTAVRKSLQTNISATLAKYPGLSEWWSQAYIISEKEWADFFG